jgi:stage II sporulation protein D
MANLPQDLEVKTYEALAVSLRSFLYALKNLYKSNKYFITTTNKYFPYKGYSNPNRNILYALKMTKNKILLYKGNPVYAYYSYDCGGITASAEEIFGYKVGYLQSVPSPFGSDDSKYAQWTYYYTYSTLTNIFSHFVKGKVSKIYVLSRTKSGRVNFLYIRTNLRSYKIKGESIYEWVPRNVLPSLVFSVYKYKDGYKIVGKGYGSGLGLPIYDANAFAQRGYSYEDILNHFYPNTTLKQLK